MKVICYRSTIAKRLYAVRRGDGEIMWDIDIQNATHFDSDAIPEDLKIWRTLPVNPLEERKFGGGGSKA